MVSETAPRGTHLDLSDDGVVDEEAPVAAAPQATSESDVVDEDADLDPADRLPKNATRNADGSVTLSLRFPRSVKSRRDGKVSERVFDTLVFHRLTGADQRAIAAVPEEMQGPVSFSRSTRINQAVTNALWDRMDLSDIVAGGQVLNNFFASGRTTGRRGSAS